MYGYIYKTTNLINGKIYVGQHKFSKDNIDRSYIGSGIHLKHAVEYYGKDNFKCEILEWCESLEKLNEAEIDWISKLNATDPTLGYNLSRGGEGIDSKFSSHPGERNGMFGSHRAGEANPNYGNRWNEDSRKKMRDIIAANGGHVGIKNPMYGKKHSDETKRKLREAAKNRKPISEASRIKMGNSRKGKKHSDETKLKMSNNNAMHKEEYRKKVSEALKGKPSPCRNTKWVHKDDMFKMVKLDKLDTYLSNGWLLGRK